MNPVQRWMAGDPQGDPAKELEVCSTRTGRMRCDRPNFNNGPRFEYPAAQVIIQEAVGREEIRIDQERWL